MKNIDPERIPENFIDLIGRQWMLITAGTPEHFNTMTASWGGIGYLWNKPVATIFVRPERYTYEFLEACDTFTLSFLGADHKAVHKITGTLSGRDTDKIKEAGLHPRIMESGAVLFDETRLGLECRTLYSDMLAADRFRDTELLSRWYGAGHGQLHKVYIAEILRGWIGE